MLFTAASLCVLLVLAVDEVAEEVDAPFVCDAWVALVADAAPPKASVSCVRVRSACIVMLLRPEASEPEEVLLVLLVLPVVPAAGVPAWVCTEVEKLLCCVG